MRAGKMRRAPGFPPPIPAFACRHARLSSSCQRFCCPAGVQVSRVGWCRPCRI